MSKKVTEKRKPRKRRSNRLRPLTMKVVSSGLRDPREGVPLKDGERVSIFFEGGSRVDIVPKGHHVEIYHADCLQSRMAIRPLASNSVELELRSREDC